MRKLIVFVSFCSTLGFGYQAITSQTLATALAALASFVVFLTALANLKSNKAKELGVSQTIGDNSSGVQIGGNVTINEKDKK
ncbi:hypothetical protein ACVXRV_003814 [Enterobacter roggenkampii]|uniref:hypothetical protein n=1 Tax=Enterobacter TaxID=547 RepID=UPI00103A8E71|nr:hypothetical protein [Enterobacter roggenkampii]EKY3955244.1 hypothetical protein [Enterobacter roggenkampii]MBU5647323.1 hypothetical protein [Pluralibacter sp. S54_ASV_43]